MNRKEIFGKIFYFLTELFVFSLLPSILISIILIVTNQFLYFKIVPLFPAVKVIASVISYLGVPILFYAFFDFFLVMITASATDRLYQILPSVINALATDDKKKFNRKLSFLIFIFSSIKRNSSDVSNKYLSQKWNYLAKKINDACSQPKINKDQLEEIANEVKNYSLKDEQNKADLKSLNVKNALTYFIPIKLLRTLLTKLTNYLWKDIFKPTFRDFLRYILSILLLLIFLAVLQYYGIDLVSSLQKLIIDVITLRNRIPA